MTAQRVLPDFLIIGAPKAATTWLLSNLRVQPQIFMPGPELHYFNRNYEHGLDWYAAHFAGASADRLIGEKSASYLADPAVPDRIAATLPTARLIVQLRNPVERAYSDYCMLLRRGEVSADIEAHLDPRRARLPRFLEDGLYGRHLTGWLDRFDRDQFLVLIYDDIRRRPGETFAQVCAFLRLEAAITAEIERRVKDKEVPMLPLTARRLLRPIKGLARPLRTHAWFRSLRGLLARPVRYPPLGASLRDRLHDYYAADVEALSHILGRDLSAWLAPAAGRV